MVTGRGLGVLDMVRSIAAGRPHVACRRARPPRRRRAAVRAGLGRDGAVREGREHGRPGAAAAGGLRPARVRPCVPDRSAPTLRFVGRAVLRNGRVGWSRPRRVRAHSGGEVEGRSTAPIRVASPPSRPSERRPISSASFVPSACANRTIAAIRAFACCTRHPRAPGSGRPTPASSNRPPADTPSSRWTSSSTASSSATASRFMRVFDHGGPTFEPIPDQVVSVQWNGAPATRRGDGHAVTASLPKR